MIPYSTSWNVLSQKMQILPFVTRNHQMCEGFPCISLKQLTGYQDCSQFFSFQSSISQLYVTECLLYDTGQCKRLTANAQWNISFIESCVYHVYCLL